MTENCYYFVHLLKRGKVRLKEEGKKCEAERRERERERERENVRASLVNTKIQEYGDV